MFEPLSTAAFPQRSRLAGPASALAHGLAFAGALGAAWWSAADPELPERAAPMPDFIVRLGPAPGSGGHGSAGPRIERPPAPQSAAFPARIPDAPTEAPPAREGPTDRIGPADAPEGGPSGPGGPGQGDCVDCVLDGEPSPGGPGDRVFQPGGQVLAPVLVARTEPGYPEAMRRARQEGIVIVSAVIGRDGAIEQAEVASATNVLFEAEALKAVRLWRYRPGTLNGQPVRVLLSVVVTFRMR